MGGKSACRTLDGLSRPSSSVLIGLLASLTVPHLERVYWTRLFLLSRASYMEFRCGLGICRSAPDSSQRLGYANGECFILPRSRPVSPDRPRGRNGVTAQGTGSSSRIDPASRASPLSTAGHFAVTVETREPRFCGEPTKPSHQDWSCPRRRRDEDSALDD